MKLAKKAKLRYPQYADLFRLRQIERGIEPLVLEEGVEYTRPGKVPMFIVADGFGAEITEFYEHPGSYWLVGVNGRDMMRRLAAAFAWPSPKALDDEIQRQFPEGRPSGPMTDEESYPNDPPAQLEAPQRPRSRWREAVAALAGRPRL